MKKIRLHAALLFAVSLSVTGVTFSASENFSADANHNVREGSDPLTASEIIDLYNVEYNQEDSLVVHTSDVDYDTPGTYQIAFDDTNAENTTTTYYRDLTVTDCAPSIDLENENVQTLGNKSPDSYDLKALFGPRASELATGDLTDQIVIDDSEVVYNQIGHNNVYFTVSDDEGNTVTEVGDLYFRELAPEITASEEADSFVNTELTEDELIELFNVEVVVADGSYEITVNDRDVNYNKIGSYPVKFYVEDIYGNRSETITSTLNIIEENKIPLTADASHSVVEGTTPLTASELIETYHVEYNTDNTLIVHTIDVDYNTPGSYPVSFEEKDSNGNSETIYSEMVVTDVLPTISFVEPHVQALVNDPIDLIDAFGVVATEQQTGDLNEFITVDDSEVDYMHVGHYPVYFTVSDEEGNTASEEGDLYLRSSAPTLTADSEHSVNENSVWTNVQLLSLYNVSATDKDGIDYIDVDTSRVDFTTPGRYTITFTAYDIYGMNSFEYYSIIEVKDLLPEILTDNSEITIESGSDYDLAQLIGIHASEIISDDLDSQVVIDDSQVNYDQAGSYTVTLTVSDDEGNMAQAIVTVTIVEAESDECLNNGGHTNNSINCRDEDATCNNNGSNDCLNENNGTNGNSNGNSDKNNGKGNNKN